MRRKALRKQKSSVGGRAAGTSQGKKGARGASNFMPQRATWLMRGGSLRYAPIPVLPLLLLLRPVPVHTVCNNDCSSSGTNLKYAQLVQQHYTVTSTTTQCGAEGSSNWLGTKTVAECAKACRLLDKPHFTSMTNGGDGNCKCTATCEEEDCTGCVRGTAFRGCGNARHVTGGSNWLGAPKTPAQCADLCEAYSPAKNLVEVVDFNGGDQNCACVESCDNGAHAQMTTYKIIRGCTGAGTGWRGSGNSAKWCAATCHALGKKYFHRVTGGDNNCNCYDACNDLQDAAFTAYEIVTTSTPGTVGTQLSIYDSDSSCDDGGPGSVRNVCDLGTDCQDCSIPSPPPPSPPPPSPPPPSPPPSPPPPSPPFASTDYTVNVCVVSGGVPNRFRLNRKCVPLFAASAPACMPACLRAGLHEEASTRSFLPRPVRNHSSEVAKHPTLASCTRQESIRGRVHAGSRFQRAQYASIPVARARVEQLLLAIVDSLHQHRFCVGDQKHEHHTEAQIRSLLYSRWCASSRH